MQTKAKRRPGRPPEKNRDNSTNEKRIDTKMAVFKKSHRTFLRLFLSSTTAKNRYQFFDAIINYVYENQKDFYNYFEKLPK